MLTEGWDCNTVTHIVGLRPFMSQLLCEQVVGRGLRRRSYEVGEDGMLTEEVAKVFGVPFEVIPFKANPQGRAEAAAEAASRACAAGRAQSRDRVPARRGLPAGDSQPRDGGLARPSPPLWLDPAKIPPEVEVKASLAEQHGAAVADRPGQARERRPQSVSIRAGACRSWCSRWRKDLTREYVKSGSCEAPAHVLFPQLVRIVQQYVDEKVTPIAPAERVDLVPVAVLRLGDRAAGRGHPAGHIAGRSAGSAALRDEPRPGLNGGRRLLDEQGRARGRQEPPELRRRRHEKWEQSAAYHIDTHAAVDAFVKNAGLGFAIPYLHNGQPHDYMPDFIIRLKKTPVVHLILETKGFDELADVKAAAQRWVAAVNADGQFGRWEFEMARAIPKVRTILEEFIQSVPC